MTRLTTAMTNPGETIKTRLSRSSGRTSSPIRAFQSSTRSRWCRGFFTRSSLSITLPLFFLRIFSTDSLTEMRFATFVLVLFSKISCNEIIFLKKHMLVSLTEMTFGAFCYMYIFSNIFLSEEK